MVSCSVLDHAVKLWSIVPVPKPLGITTGVCPVTHHEFNTCIHPCMIPEGSKSGLLAQPELYANVAIASAVKNHNAVMQAAGTEIQKNFQK